MKGQSIEFTIELKKASGSVVRDISTYAGMKVCDVFFTELWTSDATIVDGSHTWYSDTGVSSYNSLLHIEQMIAIPKAIGTFHFLMDTLEAQPRGRINDLFSQMRDLTDVFDMILREALSKKVDITQMNEGHASISYFIVTFREIFE